MKVRMPGNKIRAAQLIAGGMLILAAALSICAGTQASFYVSPGGSDNNPGTEALPFKTIAKARDTVRTMNRTMTGDIYVCLRCGNHYVTTPLQFTPLDGGTNGYSVIYKAYTGETPVISGGGVPVTGWTVYSGNIYQATLNRDTKLRFLYVNGIRAAMAEDTSKHPSAVATYGTYTVAGTEPWAMTSGSTLDGLQFNPTDVGVYGNPGDVELEWNWQWCFNIIGARNIISQGGRTVIQLGQPYGAIAARLRWGWIGVNNQNGVAYKYTIKNAFELLKYPGQFYFNKVTHTLFYYSRGENMATAKVIAPVSEGLVQIFGTSTSARVKNLQFYGIAFMHDHYQMYDVAGSKGFIGSQSTAVFYRFRSDGDHAADTFNNEDIPQGSVWLRNCDSLRFERCKFYQLGSMISLNLENDVSNTAIIGNVFRDCAGNAINLGHPQHWRIGDGPKFPSGMEGVCRNITVRDNFIKNVSIMYKREEGISGYHLQNIVVSHNQVEYLPYGTIAIGWYWGASGSCPASAVPQNIKIDSNRAGNDHHFLADGGTLYCMGPTPTSEVAGNYVYNAPIHLMPDEGAGFWTFKNNVCENATTYWLLIWSGTTHDCPVDNNYTNKTGIWNSGTNCPNTNLHTETAAPPWSSGAQSIINAAGIESAYSDVKTDTLLPPDCPVAVKPEMSAKKADGGGFFTVVILGHVLHLPTVCSGKSLAFEIFNMKGCIVLKLTMGKNRVLYGNTKKVLQRGTYIIRCTGDNVHITRRLMVIR